MSTLLEDYITPVQLTAERGITLRTLRRWEQKRIAPPRVAIERQIFYRVTSVKSWLESREQRKKK
jgi:hypothetical protein